MLARLVSALFIGAVVYLLLREALVGDVSCWFDHMWYELGVKSEPTC